MRWNWGPQRVQKIPLNASGRAASTSRMLCGSKAHPVMQISQQKSSEIIWLGNMFQCFGLNKLALERWKENTRAQTQYTLCLTSAFLMFFPPLNQFKVCFSFHPRPSSALTCCNFSCIWKQTQRQHCLEWQYCFFFEVHRTIKPLLYKASPVSSVSYVAPLILDVSQQLNRCLYTLIQARLSFFPQRPFDPSDRESAGGNPVIKHCASVKLMPPSSPRGLFLFRLSEAPPELEDGLKDGLNSPVEMFSLWVWKSILHSFGWMRFVKKNPHFSQR